MGLFSKKPNGSQQVYIQSAINEVQTQYKYLTQVERVDWFVEAYENIYKSMNFLLDSEKRFPSFFGKYTPSTNMKKIESERNEMEKQFIDRFFLSIEKKLLEYSTMRGKKNNFIKETDKFRYYAGEFLPESVDYFNNIIETRYPEYM